MNGSAVSAAVSTPQPSPNSFAVTSSTHPHIAAARNAMPAITRRLELNTMWRLSSWRNSHRCCADGAIVHTVASAASASVTM